MDHFGIGNAIRGAMVNYINFSRGTGRTTSLVDIVKNGDRVVFVDRCQAMRFEALCKDRLIDVETFVCDPAHPDRLFDKGSVLDDGRLIFDHVWVEKFYLNAIVDATNYIDKLQHEFSGFSEAHQETRRSAKK